MTVSGLVICLLPSLSILFRTVVIGLIGTWINGIAVDYFTAIINRRKRVCIICDDHDKVREYIICTLQRGCSLYEVTGGYNGRKNVEIREPADQR